MNKLPYELLCTIFDFCNIRDIIVLQSFKQVQSIVHDYLTGRVHLVFARFFDDFAGFR